MVDVVSSSVPSTPSVSELVQKRMQLRGRAGNKKKDLLHSSLEAEEALKQFWYPCYFTNVSAGMC